MYARTGEARTLTFGVSGKLYRNVLVMFDRETESLWSHLLGAAFAGPLRGTRLTTVPSVHADWKTWREAYPRGRVLSKAKSPKGWYGRDPYEGYYYSSATGIIPVTERDTRVFPKEYVLGLEIGDRAKAYPFSALTRSSLVHDRVGTTPLVAAFDPKALTGLFYDRRVDERVLTFERLGADPWLLRDRETGSRWNVLTGDAIEGPLKGQRLRPIPATTAFWFGWRDHYPRTEVFEAAAH